MPRELKTEEEFAKALDTASEVRIVKRGDSTKLKLRTPEGLFTFKTTEKDADSLIKGTKVPKVEL